MQVMLKSIVSPPRSFDPFTLTVTLFFDRAIVATPEFPFLGGSVFSTYAYGFEPFGSRTATLSVNSLAVVALPTSCFEPNETD